MERLIKLGRRNGLHLPKETQDVRKHCKSPKPRLHWIPHLISMSNFQCHVLTAWMEDNEIWFISESSASLDFPFWVQCPISVSYSTHFDFPDRRSRALRRSWATYASTSTSTWMRTPPACPSRGKNWVSGEADASYSVVVSSVVGRQRDMESSSGEKAAHATWLVIFCYFIRLGNVLYLLWSCLIFWWATTNKSYLGEILCYMFH